MENNFEKNLDAIINISINKLNELEKEDFSIELENIMKEFETKTADEKGEEFSNYTQEEKEYAIEEIFNNLETDEKKQQFINELTEIYDRDRIVDPESIDSIIDFIAKKEEELKDLAETKEDIPTNSELSENEAEKDTSDLTESDVTFNSENPEEIKEQEKGKIEEKTAIEKYIEETNKKKALLEELKKNQPPDEEKTESNEEDLNKLIEENNKSVTIDGRDSIKEYEEKIEKLEKLDDPMTQKIVEEFKIKLNLLKEYYQIIDEMNSAITNKHIPSVFIVDEIKNSKLSYEQKNELVGKYNIIVEKFNPSVFMKKDNEESKFYQREEINELNLRIDMLKKYGTPEWTMNGNTVKNNKLTELEDRKKEVEAYFEIIDNINKLFDGLAEPEAVQEMINKSDFSNEVKEELEEKYNKTMEYCKNKKTTEEITPTPGNNDEITELEKEIAEREKNIATYKEADKNIDELNTRLDNKEQIDSPEIQNLINNIKNKIEPLPQELKDELNKKLNNVLNKKRKKGLKVIAKKVVKWMKEHKLVCIAIGLALTTALLLAIPATQMMINSALWNVGSKLGWGTSSLNSLHSANLGLSSLVKGGKFAFEGMSGAYTLGGAAGAQALYTAGSANLVGALAGLTGLGALGTGIVALKNKIKNWKKKKKQDEPEKFEEKEQEEKEPEIIKETDKEKEKTKVKEEESGPKQSNDNAELLTQLKEALKKSNETNAQLLEQNRILNEKLNQMFKMLTPEQQKAMTGNVQQDENTQEFEESGMTL